MAGALTRRKEILAGGVGPLKGFEVFLFSTDPETVSRYTEAGVDGFNLVYSVTPGTFVDFIDGVVPVLQARGLVQRGEGAGVAGCAERRLRAAWEPGAVHRGKRLTLRPAVVTDSTTASWRSLPWSNAERKRVRTSSE